MYENMEIISPTPPYFYGIRLGGSSLSETGRLAYNQCICGKDKERLLAGAKLRITYTSGQVFAIKLHISVTIELVRKSG